MRDHAKEFLDTYHPSLSLPVPIELIVEEQFEIDIVPVPGLQNGFDVVAFISKDLSEIRVDQYVFENRENRYRFSLAHELAHRILHSELMNAVEFNDVSSWKSALHAIPDRDYSFVESQANNFAGMVLVPSALLQPKFDAAIELVRQSGLDPIDHRDAVTEYVATHLANSFTVSTAVIHRRIQKDNLWDALA